MEIRRVQITGGSSFMITLPKGWADSIGLEKNDPVVVIPQPNGSLLLSAGNVPIQETQDTSEIDADSVPDSSALYRELIGAYIAGHGQIAVFSKHPLRGAMLEAVSKFTQTSIGMEIVEEDESRIVMKDLIDQTEVLPQKNVRREYLLVKRMVNDVFTNSNIDDLAHLDGMADRDTEVDRIHWLVQRQASIHQTDIGLSTRMGIDIRTVTGCVGVSKTLERMGDHAVLIAGYLQKLGPDALDKIGKAMAQIAERMADLIDSSFTAWSDGDLEKAEKCIRDSKEISSEIPDLLGVSSFPPVSILPASMISGSMRRLAEYCTDIGESAINVAMETPGKSE